VIKDMVALDQHGIVEITDSDLLATVADSHLQLVAGGDEPNGACLNNGCDVETNTGCHGSNGSCVGAANVACGSNVVCQPAMQLGCI
jgi:hypothetical protein